MTDTDTDTNAGSDAPPAEPLDWDARSAGGRTLAASRRTAGFLAAVAALGAGFCYHYAVVPPGEPLVGEWVPAPLDWLFALSLLVVAFHVAVPLARRPRLTRRYWRDLRARPPATASLAYLCVFVAVALLGPVLVGPPRSHGAVIHNPPVGVGVPSLLVGDCAGRVVEGTCYGSLEYPLGTTAGGVGVLAFVVAGARVALEVALLTVTLLVPVAVAVGAGAAYLGGWADEAAMRYVDVQQVVPPFFVYIVAQFLYGGSLLLIVAVFGLLNWGGTARLVRSETLQRSEAAFVRAARNAGGSRAWIVRRHLLPNVANTVVTAATLQMSTLVLIEATLAYLGFGSPTAHSWGNLIAIGMHNFPAVWWTATFPALALMGTVASLHVLGDALRDVLDPRDA